MLHSIFTVRLVEIYRETKNQIVQVGIWKCSEKMREKMSHTKNTDATLLHKKKLRVTGP